MQILHTKPGTFQREMAKAQTGSFLKRKIDEYEALRLGIEAQHSEIEAKNSEVPNNK